MKGIIFQIGEEIVTEQFGKQQWEQIRQKAGVSAQFFVPMEDYPDAEFVSIVKQAASALGRSTDEVERTLGALAIPKLAALYRFYFEPYSSAREFLLKMDDVHQVTTQTIAGAMPPRFHYERPSDSSLVITYSSARKLCSFLQGLIEGSASYYNERARITERCCMKKGAPRCELVVEFSR